ncbi:MAG: XrtA/PEP-CTERM system TPR-repeat protein PrsT [Geminicoccaceae bacterium]
MPRLGLPNCSRALAVASVLLLATAPAAWAATDRSQDFLDNARQRLEQGDVRAAIIELRNALQTNPDNLEARETLGRLYLQIGQPDAAEKELRRAYTARPSDATGFLLGQALLALNRPAEVLEITGASASDPELARQQALLRAEAMLNLGRLDDAQTVIEAQSTGRPQDPTVNLLLARLHAGRGDLAGADSAVGQALAAAPDSVPGWLLKAQIDLSAGRSQNAEQAARKVLELSPGNIPAQLALAEIDFRRGRLEQAEAQAKSAREQAPASVPATYLLANIQAARGDYAEADRTMRQIADAVRDFPPALFLSGSLKARTGQLAQAQDLLARYLALVPADRNARRLLAAVQLDADQARTGAETLAPLTGPQSQDVASLQLLASAQLRSGDLDGARRSFSRLARVGQPAEAQQAASFLALLDSQAAKPGDRATQAILIVLDDLRRARLDEALKGAEALAATGPKNPEMLNLLGAVRLARGEDEAARAQFEAALVVDPAFQGALDNLDRLDIRAGQTARVEERLRRRLQKNPQDEATLLRLAGVLAGNERAADAEGLLRTQATALPRSVRLRLALAAIYRARNEPARVLAVADELAAIGEAGDPAGLDAAGNLYLAGQQPARAVAAFQSLSNRQPDNLGARLMLARAQYLAGDQAAARTTVESVRQQAPGNTIANNSLVDLRLAAGDTQGALDFARSLTATDRTQAAQLQAKVLLTAKRGGEAVTVLDQALAADPNPTLARALFVARNQNGQQREAVDGLRTWVVDHPDDAGNLDLLSQAMIKQGDYAEAAAMVEQTAQLVPSNPVVLNNLAWLRYELGQPGAEDLARRAHQLAPGSPEVADTLGWILARSGKLEEGLALLREADSGAQGGNPDIRYHLAYALQASGQNDPARTILQELVAVEAPFSERQAAEQLLARLTPS